MKTLFKLLLVLAIFGTGEFMATNLDKAETVKLEISLDDPGEVISNLNFVDLSMESSKQHNWFEEVTPIDLDVLLEIEYKNSNKNLTLEDFKEREVLIRLKNNDKRFFSQEEFNRLKYLDNLCYKKSNDIENKADRILKEVKNKGEISIDFKDLFDIPDFKTGKEESSIESLGLVLGGHTPVKDYNFDVTKLQTWCNENNLNFYLDKKERLLHLKA